MESIRKPDLKAPRYRPRRYDILNKEFCQKFREHHPQYKDVSDETIKNIVKAFNSKIVEKVIELRDGVELPEGIGYIFIGSCPRLIRENINYGLSITLEQKLHNLNLQSDRYTAKIFYTNFSNKYKFRHRDLWGFSGTRVFKRAVAKTYPELWKQYLVVDNWVKVSKLFKKHKYKNEKQLETSLRLEEYDEFDI